LSDNTDSAVPEGAPVPDAYPAPADISQSFEPMADAFAQPEAEQPIYNDDFEGLSQAAAEVVSRRSNLERPIVDREYRLGPDGERASPQDYISAERGADDLARVRAIEEGMLAEAKNDAVRAELDALRGVQPEQPAPAPEAPPLKPQAEQIEQPGETKLQRALREDPEFRGQVEAMVQAAEAYQQRAAAELQAERQRIENEYVARANTAAAEVSALLASMAPELQGAKNEDEIRGRLETLRMHRPDRFREVVGLMERAQAATANQLRYTQEQQVAAQQAHQQAQAQYQQQWAQWADQQDGHFEAAVKGESPETLRTVKDALPAVFQKYGVDTKQIYSLYQHNDVVRSAPFQRMLFDLAKYHVAQENVRAAVQRPVPTVNRPGVSEAQPRGEDGRFASAYNAFMGNPSPSAREGAALIAARRARGG
jgi:hypothetical protein